MGISVIVVGKLLLKVAVGCLLSIQSFNTGWGSGNVVCKPKKQLPPFAHGKKSI